ncbi:MAG: stage sporulation protein [Clostridiales bacterium]|nr:stage sporulation protein [Clostridiales bacterium]
MKKKAILLFAGIFVLMVLIGLQMFSREALNHNIEVTEEYTGGQTRITRAEVARMMTLLVYSREDLLTLSRTISYTDTDTTKWYDKFINGYVTMGLAFDEDTIEFHPMSYYTYEDCQKLFEHLKKEKPDNVALDAIALDFQEKIANKSVSDTITPSEWIALYQRIALDVYGIELETKPLYFIESWEKSESLDKWQVLTNEGICYGDGLNFLPYLDEKYEVYIKDNEILSLSEKQDGETKIPNVWIIGKEETDLKVFFEGFTKMFALAGDIEANVLDQVSDLYIEHGKIVKVSIKADRIKGKILLTNDHYIEIEHYGKKPLTEDFRIYRTYGELSMDKTNSLVVGYENAEFVVVGDEICAAIITKPVKAKDIRVLLKTTDFSDIYHKSVKVTSDSDFQIVYGETKKSYKAGKIVTIKKNSAWFQEGRVEVIPKEEGSITIKSIKRNGKYPSYEGELEIASQEEGLLIINELPIEKYLYGVVPSEMPSSYEYEALKVQAVCARSYAYKQLIGNGLRKYGAHVDDSASYQVYNNVSATNKTKKAVDATEGIVLKYEGNVVPAYYFSTSSGYTADASQVWDSVASISYLTGGLQFVSGNEKKEAKYQDLSDESAFRSFLKEKEKTYDSQSPWFRWSVEISKERLTKEINRNLEARYEATPNLILTMSEDETYQSVPIHSIGNITSIVVGKREASGIISEIIIKGKQNTIKVESEYNIRMLLSPGEGNVIRNDGSKIAGLSMLPSAYFYIEKTENGFMFRGGGYGHGVGMSQNGANQMAKLGYDYKEILKHYYKETEAAVE